MRDAQPVTEDVIARAALGVLADDGPGALSFRRVAADIGTSHMTVHRLCGSFEGLLDLCAEQLAGQMTEVESGRPWATSTEQRFTALYELMAANSALVALQRGRPWLGPEMMRRFAEPAVAESLAAGLTLRETVRVHRCLYMFTVGCALTHTTYDTSRGEDVLGGLDPQQTPVLARERRPLLQDLPTLAVFHDGLRTLIAAADPQPRGTSQVI